MICANKIKAVLLTLVIQLFVVALFFLGFLLDPLIGIWVVAVYFFVVGSFCIYRFILGKFAQMKRA